MSTENKILVMKEEDARYIWSLLPEWVRTQPENLSPMFYGTGSEEGDKKVKQKVEVILGLNKTKQ